MASRNDVHRLALLLPQTVERPSQDGLLDWRVKDKSFACERPLRRADLQALGDAAPRGPILAARVPDLAPSRRCWPMTPRSTSPPRTSTLPAILVRLDQITLGDLEELLVEAWLCRAARPSAWPPSTSTPHIERHASPRLAASRSTALSG
jgi:hypothetical protein